MLTSIPTAAVNYNKDDLGIQHDSEADGIVLAFIRIPPLLRSNSKMREPMREKSGIQRLLAGSGDRFMNVSYRITTRAGCGKAQAVRKMW